MTKKARGFRIYWFLWPFEKQYGCWAVCLCYCDFFVVYWMKQPLFRPYSFGCRWMNMNVVYWWNHNSNFINTAQSFLVPHFESQILHGLPWDQLTYCNSACEILCRYDVKKCGNSGSGERIALKFVCTAQWTLHRLKKSVNSVQGNYRCSEAFTNITEVHSLDRMCSFECWTWRYGL